MECIEIENVITTRVYPATVWSTSESFQIWRTCGREDGRGRRRVAWVPCNKNHGGKIGWFNDKRHTKRRDSRGLQINKNQNLNTSNVGFKSMCWLTGSPHELAWRQLANQRVRDNIQCQFLYLYSTFKWVAPGLYGWFGAPGYWEHYRLLIQSCMSNSLTNVIYEHIRKLFQIHWTTAWETWKFVGNKLLCCACWCACHDPRSTPVTQGKVLL